MRKQKLVVLAPVRDMDVFRHLVGLLGNVSDLYDISVEVGTLLRKHREELTDPGDSYLDYSVNTPSIFKHIVPEKLRPYLDTSFARENLALLEAKVEVLKQAGMKASFYGNEPVYQRERLYRAFPHWRGARIDHPRRSRNPIWSPCLLQPEVQEVYRQAVAELCRRVGIMDTFVLKTNDAGSGFCYASILYNRPNGPAACRSVGAAPHVAALHRAVIEGARQGGAEVETFMSNVRPSEQADLCRPLMPEGSHLLPERGEGMTGSMSGGLGGHYPLRYLLDPLGFLTQLERNRERRPRTIIFSLGAEYQKGHADLDSTELQLRLIRAFSERPTGTLKERLALLTDVASELYDVGPAEAMVEAWYQLHEYEKLRSVWPRPQYFITYGCLSARWLTRPLVAFPRELTAPERDYWLPHVFNGFGDEARLGLLDIHGGRAGDLVGPARELALRNGWFDTVDASLARATKAFDTAAGKGVDYAAKAARSAAITRCFYRSARHALEFGLLMEQVQPRDGMWELGERHEGDPQRAQVYRILRDELDNTLDLIDLLGEGAEDVLVMAGKPEDEDTFLLGPGLVDQLSRKREIMLAHWADFDRLFLPPHL